MWRTRTCSALPTILSVVVVAAVCVAAAAQNANYSASVNKWRAEYEADLKSDHGWLTIAGLFWLHEGENRFGSSAVNDIILPQSAPPDVGSFDYHDGKVLVRVNPAVSATIAGAPVTRAEVWPSGSRIEIAGIALWVHSSGDRLAVRMQDKNSPLRANFSGLHWYPINESYRVTARYVSLAEPKTIDSQNVLGDPLKLRFLGYVAFTLHGQEYRLLTESPASGGLSFVFRDLTAGKETYPAGRFLDTEPPKDGEVVLDFNEAYNPPCAYNPYTTCPVPPPENRLNVRIEAGEMAYRHDH
ncbi:MAG TPA: DUF1684 domain-containing protein [Methylomirabilota bacterium]|nr:DUF1684 domain-containing protein [Methylomirabilota bacterium]